MSVLISLLAFLLEHFYKQLQLNYSSYKLAKPKEVNLTQVCRHIAAHYNYLRQSKSIYDYVRLRKGHSYQNPIKVCRNIKLLILH